MAGHRTGERGRLAAGRAAIGAAWSTLWRAGRAPRPARLPWWDRWLAVALVVAAPVEVLARDEVPWPVWTAALAMVCGASVAWRTRHPLAMLVVGFGAQTLAGVVPALAGADYGVPTMTACVLLLPYSLGRYGSGRAVLAGAVVLMAGHWSRETFYGESLADNLVGAGFLLLPLTLGSVVRQWSASRSREAEQVRLTERERIARDLHDTIAHHVSGIVLQAQAARTVAAADPQRALSTLPAIEEAAVRSLAEMRAIVGLLREDGPADAPRLPAQRVADLPRLFAEPVPGPAVAVALSGQLSDLPSPVEAAVYRVVQESVTNARRHARGATRVDVRITGDPAAVRVEVSDDGSGRRGRTGSGFGLVGMAERVEALGGRVSAGPASGRGWRVDAVVPRPEAGR